MADRTVPINAFGWTSLCSGIIGVLLIIVLTIYVNSTASKSPNNLDFLYWIIVILPVLGLLGILSGMGVVMSISLGSRLSWLPPIAGILLGLLNLIIGGLVLTIPVGLF